MNCIKIIPIVLTLVFLLQVNIYSLQAYKNKYCLATPSILNKFKIIIQNNDYQLTKINENHYIYSDKTHNIHMYNTQDVWQSVYNGAKCELAGGEIRYIHGDIFVCLLKKGYQIKEIKDNVIYLKLKDELKTEKLRLDGLSLELEKPEEIVIEDLRKVLINFKASGLEELNVFETLLARVLNVAKGIRSDTILYKSEHRRMHAIKATTNILGSQISDFLCSQKVEVQLLGDHLKSKIEYLAAQQGFVRSIANDIIFQIESSLLLLQKCLIEQFIISTLETKLSLGTDSFIREFHEDDTQNNWVIKLKDTQEEIAQCIFPRKNAGVQFGTGMIVKYDEKLKIPDKKYFVKSHQFYPIAKSESARTGFSSVNIQKPDLKEVFVYKMFDKLDLGAKTHFVVNPYVRTGLFIISEDVADSEDTFFEEASKLEEDRVFKEILQKELQKKQSTPLKVSINKFDLLGRIFNLTDFNSNNFGVVKRTSGGLEWRMLDFRVGMEERPTSMEEFLSANSRFYYKEGGILADVLKNRTRLDKIQIGMDAMDDFKKHQNFNKKLEETASEILIYLQQVLHEQGATIADLLGMLFEDERQKLEDYKKYVMNNFTAIYEGLGAEYARNIFEESLKQKGLKLTIEVSSGDKAPLRRFSIDERSKIFTISNDVLISSGRIFNLFGYEDLESIVEKVINSKIKGQDSLLIEWREILLKSIEKLELLEHVDNFEKINALSGLLVITGMEEMVDASVEFKSFQEMKKLITSA